MNVFTLCGVVLLCVCLILILRRLSGELAVIFSLCAAVFLLFYAASDLTEVFVWFREACEGSALAPYLSILIKSLGIALLTGFLAELCRDLGEGTLCRATELCGKAAILLLALPLMKEFLEMILSAARSAG